MSTGTTGTAGRMLAAARDILLAEGAAAVSMRRVADAVGVTPMAIYRHYPNRDALLHALAEDGFAELAGSWGRRTGSADAQERLAGLLEDFLDFALGSPHLYTFLMTERRPGARAFPDGFRHGASPAFEPLLLVIEDGMRRGVFSPGEAMEVALTVTAYAHGLLALYLGGRLALPEPEFRALCRRSLHTMLTGIRA